MAGKPEDRRERDERGKRTRDIGIFTAIPMMLLAGPALGYLIGHWAGGRWGHQTTWQAVGAVVGLLAAARQIWSILKEHGSNQ